MRSSIDKRSYISLLSLPVCILLAVTAGGRSPDDIEVLLREGESFFDEGVYGNAAATYTRVLEVDPGNEEAIYGYTYSLLALDERLALDYLKGGLDENPESLPEEVLVELSLLWCRRGKTDEALELLGKIDSPAASAARGKVYLYRGENGAAVKELKKGYVLGDPDTRFFLAEALLAEGRFGEAVERLTEFSEKYHYLPEVYAALGETYQLDGRYDDAQEQYETALNYDATCRRALGGLGRMSFERGDYGSAIKYYNEILIVDPWDAAALFNLALVYEEVDRSVARTKWTQYLEMHGSNPIEARRVKKVKEKLGMKK